jgi:hypothetical protein
MARRLEMRAAGLDHAGEFNGLRLRLSASARLANERRGAGRAGRVAVGKHRWWTTHVDAIVRVRRV